MSSEEEWLDILGSGKLTKKVIKAGDGVKPKPGQQVSIRYSEAIQKLNEKREIDGPAKVVSGNKGKGQKSYTFRVGENDVIVAWDMCIPLMTVGEIAIIRCHSDFAYGQAGCPPLVPPNRDMEYEITLVSLGEERGYDEESMTVEKRIEFAKIKKERGNELFKRNDYSGAFNSYSLAIKVLQKATEKEMKSAHPSILLESKNILVICHNNKCQVQITMKVYDKARESASIVLKLDPKNIKGLYRMAQICMPFQEFEQAKSHLQKVLDIDSKHTGAAKLMKEVQLGLSKQYEDQKKLYKNMMTANKSGKYTQENINEMKKEIATKIAERTRKSSTPKEVELDDKNSTTKLADDVVVQDKKNNREKHTSETVTTTMTDTPETPNSIAPSSDALLYVGIFAILLAIIIKLFQYNM